MVRRELGSVNYWIGFANWAIEKFNYDVKDALKTVSLLQGDVYSHSAFFRQGASEIEKVRDAKATIVDALEHLEIDNFGNV